MDVAIDDGGVLLGVEEKPELWAAGGSEGTFGSTPYARSEAGRIASHLNQKLSRQECRTRPGPGGVQLTYIEGWKVIQEANLIFGFNGWSTQVLSKDIHYIDAMGSGRYMTAVSALVRVTLRDGTTREDYGCGSAEGLRSKGDAISKALKEAVTDATKRALKGFGPRLGLSLYDKEHVREMKKGPPPQRGSSAPPQGRRAQTADGNSGSAARRSAGNQVQHQHQQQRAVQDNARPRSASRPQMVQAGAQTNAQCHPGTRRQSHAGLQGQGHSGVQANAHLRGGVTSGILESDEDLQIQVCQPSNGLNSGSNYGQAASGDTRRRSGTVTNHPHAGNTCIGGSSGARHAELHRAGSTRSAAPAAAAARDSTAVQVEAHGVAACDNEATGVDQRHGPGMHVAQKCKQREKKHAGHRAQCEQQRSTYQANSARGVHRVTGHTSAGSPSYGNAGVQAQAQGVYGSGHVATNCRYEDGRRSAAPPEHDLQRGVVHVTGIYEASPVTPGTNLGKRGSKRQRVENRAGGGGGTQARREARAAQVKNEVDELHRIGAGVFQ